MASSSWTTFWQTVIRFQKDKITPWIALRNTLGMVIPLAAGVYFGFPRAGLAFATGALNVSFSDSHEPHILRARRMLAASVLIGLAAFAGGIAGRSSPTITIVAGLWAFAAGMLVAIGTGAADLGVLSLCLVIVYAAVPLNPTEAASAGALAFTGGILQTAISLGFWGLRRYVPAREALAALFRELGRATGSTIHRSEAPPASLESTKARESLALFDNDRSIQAQRFRFLLSEAERARLSLLVLIRLQGRIDREMPGYAAVAQIERFVAECSGLLLAIGDGLASGEPPVNVAEGLRELQKVAESLRTADGDAHPIVNAMVTDARRQMDAIAGQLRACVELSSSATPAGLEAFERREARTPRHLRLVSTLATLRANLNLRSASFRHAVRLAVCVAFGEAVARGFELHRSYWLPMTIAIVLKPDFSATFSRGVLRLAGTFAGLVISTILFHMLPAGNTTEIALITVMMFVLRWLGSANYGIFVTAITALVVLLIAMTGVSPPDVIAARGLNTVWGGIIALLAYWFWPTWERGQVREMLAAMLDAYRAYFQAIRDSYMKPGFAEEDVSAARLAGRLARSNLEASIDRLGAEPGTPPETISALSGILASSHRLAHSFMALEGGLAASAPAPARAAFRPFSNDVDLTLYYLAAALRGSPVALESLPDLREDHHALVNSGDSLTERYALVNVETDRITNSLNTLAGQVLRLQEAPQ